MGGEEVGESGSPKVGKSGVGSRKTEDKVLYLRVLKARSTGLI